MRFCGNCGSALEVPAAAGEERKVVTILFADVVASTALSSSVDPERLRDQMARFFDIARQEIERYGGTVEKFIGDAVMAVFGLPTIHEDDPERAARAAAAMRDRLQPLVVAGGLPPIRIGLAAGEVVANPRAAEKGEFLVTGEVVNLAARLQQHAEGGQILMTERTMRALRRAAALRPVPPLTVKGRSDPLLAWELLEVAPPREREVRTTLFVGREEELDLLPGHVRRMRREGRGHVVTILGPAGVGKTRLVQEFRRRAADVHSLRGRALPYGTGVPLWAVGEAIREECGILFGDPLETARQKLERAAAQLDLPDALPALLSILGLGGAGRDLTREELFAGMRAFFQSLAYRAPLLLILEDLHSAEDVTLDYLEHSADWIREVPILLVILSRPELLERRPTWMGGKRSASTLYLDPLGGEESRALALALLDGKPAPEQLMDLVLVSAEGNPLFMEEMLRSLIERGILTEESEGWDLAVPLAQVTIPDTVHAVIAARVDALAPVEKRVLQVSAIQGKDFWVGGVRYVIPDNHVDEALAALERKELVIRKPRSMVVGEEEFTFRHILIRDVAYGLIPKAQRWAMHARVAEWTHQTAGDRQAEWAFYIAHHWLQVVSLRQDLGMPPDEYAHGQAIANLLLAGDRAATVYANTTALDQYSRALDLNPPPEVRLRALLGRGAVWMLLGQFERAREDFGAARTLAQEIGDRRAEAMALDYLGHSYRRQDLIGEALAHLQPALTLSREIGDPELTGRILNHIGFTYFSDARHDEAIRHHEEARRLLEGAGDMAVLAESLHGLGENLMFWGRYQESIGYLLESARICEVMGNRSLAGENRFMVAHGRQILGDYAGAEAEVQRSLAILEEIGDIWNLSVSLWAAAGLAIPRGDFGKALGYAARGASLAHQLGALRFQHYNLLHLSQVHRELEDHHGAWQVDRETAELAGKARGAWMAIVQAYLALDLAALDRPEEAEPHLRAARQALQETQSLLDFDQTVTHAEGRVLLMLGRAADALAAADRLSALVAGTGTLHWRVPSLLLGADAAAALGETRAAASGYERAVEEAERAGLLPALWRALAGLAETERSLGDPVGAAASAARAREVIERLAATVPDERLRAVFLQSAKVQRVAALAGG